MSKRAGETAITQLTARFILTPLIFGKKTAAGNQQIYQVERETTTDNLTYT
jgi:hypothetical protein